MKSAKRSTQLLTYDQLLARVRVLEDALRTALGNSMMPRQLVASLTALLPDATAESAAEYRED